MGMSRTMSDRYENWFLKQKMKDEGIEDLSGDIPESAQKTDWLGRSNLTQNENVVPLSEAESETVSSDKASAGEKGGLAAAKTAASGGNALDVASTGLMASGHPYAVGAGLALQTINTINKRKQQQEQNRYIAELQKVQARQEAINKLAQIGQNLRA